MQFSASHFLNSLQLGLLRVETDRKEGRAFGLDKWSLSNSTNRPSSTLHPFGILFYRLYMLNKTKVKFEICLLSPGTVVHVKTGRAWKRLIVMKTK